MLSSVEIKLVEGVGCTTGALAGLPRQRSGWAGGLLSGVRGTWGCQGAWQVETQRPVTRGKHGSVREDRTEGMEVVEEWSRGLSDEVRRGYERGGRYVRSKWGQRRRAAIEMIREELSKCKCGWLESIEKKRNESELWRALGAQIYTSLKESETTPNYIFLQDSPHTFQYFLLLSTIKCN